MTVSKGLNERFDLSVRETWFGSYCKAVWMSALQTDRCSVYD